MVQMYKYLRITNLILDDKFFEAACLVKNLNVYLAYLEKQKLLFRMKKEGFVLMYGYYRANV